MHLNTKHLILFVVLATTGSVTTHQAFSAEAGGAANMPGMRMPAQTAETQTGHATGIVQAVNSAANTVTIVTEAVPERNWPADMSMEYKVAGDAAMNVSTGQKVNFEFAGEGMDVTITKIERAE